MKNRPTYRLDQSALDQREFVFLREALSRSHRIDAKGLLIDADRLAEIRKLMRNDSTGRSRFFGWHLQDCTFGPGCDFSQADFRSCWFDGSEFGDGASFCDSVFDYANFKGVRFGNDALFERAHLKTKAEFHGARFGDRCRFAYARFKASQFFDARFGADAGFARVVFTASAEFHAARFGPRANFAEAQFPTSVDFAGVDFGEKLQMVSVRFAGSPTFVGASFGTRARLTRWRVAGSLVMRAARFLGEMSLHGLRVEGDAIFEHAHFYGYVDLGDIAIGGGGYFQGVGFTSATRVGPIESSRELRMASLRNPQTRCDRGRFYGDGALRREGTTPEGECVVRSGESRCAPPPNIGPPGEDLGRGVAATCEPLPSGGDSGGSRGDLGVMREGLVSRMRRGREGPICASARGATRLPTWCFRFLPVTVFGGIAVPGLRLSATRSGGLGGGGRRRTD